jgi:dephospho-CoA kinase
MIIGLTGQIGEVVDGSVVLRRRLVRAFGSVVVDGRGNIRRKKLAELAFVDQSSRDKLNRLVHPYLLAELNRQMRRAGRGGRVVVVDAALLLHWEMDRQVDVVVVVHASRKLRLKRLQARGVTRKDALAREKAQLSFAEFRRRADHVVLNAGSETDLAAKARRLYGRITDQTD